MVKLLKGGVKAVGQVVTATTGMGDINELTGKREHGSFSFFVPFLRKEKDEAENLLRSITEKSVMIGMDVSDGDVEEFRLVFEKNGA